MAELSLFWLRRQGRQVNKKTSIKWKKRMKMISKRVSTLAAHGPFELNLDGNFATATNYSRFMTVTKIIIKMAIYWVYFNHMNKSAIFQLFQSSDKQFQCSLFIHNFTAKDATSIAQRQRRKSPHSPCTMYTRNLRCIPYIKTLLWFAHAKGGTYRAHYVFIGQFLVKYRH